MIRSAAAIAGDPHRQASARGDYGVHHLHDRRAIEYWLSDQQLKQHRAGGKTSARASLARPWSRSGAMYRGVPPAHLPDSAASRCDPHKSRALRQSEVEKLDSDGCQENIGGLEVTVNNAPSVKRVQRVQIDSTIGSASESEADSGNPLPAIPFQQLHGQKQLPWCSPTS
jgi:hypothetical protein